MGCVHLSGVIFEVRKSHEDEQKALTYLDDL